MYSETRRYRYASNNVMIIVESEDKEGAEITFNEIEVTLGL
jgi:hypothetical protein